VGEGVAAEEIEGGDGEEFVTIEGVAGFIDEEDAIGVAVEGDAAEGLVGADGGLEGGGMGGAALVVDATGGGVIGDGDDVGAEFAEEGGGGFAGGAVGGVDDDFMTAQGVMRLEGGADDREVAIDGGFDGGGCADGGGGDAALFEEGGVVKVAGDGCLEVVVEFVAVGAEKFDAVVIGGVVGGGDDGAAEGAFFADEGCDTGGGEDAEGDDRDACGLEAGGEGIFEHGT